MRPTRRPAYAAYVKIYPDDLKPSLAGCRLVLASLPRQPQGAAMSPSSSSTPPLDTLEREGFFRDLRGL